MCDSMDGSNGQEGGMADYLTKRASKHDVEPI
jgi:hypothetical protein